MSEANELAWIRFSIPGEPFGKQRPKFTSTGKYHKAYTPKETVSYENLVKLMFREEAHDRTFPEGSMLAVNIDAYYSIPKSVSKKKREDMLSLRIRPMKKPDADNILKIVCDSLNKIAYYDDAAVVEASVQKWYSDTPRVEVCIRVARN